MRSSLFLLALCATVPASLAAAQAIPEGLVPPADTGFAPAPGMPPAPGGRSTVMGGEIRSVDMLRDALTLKVAAGHSVRMLFDERTQVFQDGHRISLLQLRPADHASIETTLDGSDIFALRIHTMTSIPSGDLQGRVDRYDAASGKLRLTFSGTKRDIMLLVPSGTPITRNSSDGAASLTSSLEDLIPGSFVDVTFTASQDRSSTATKIRILAAPGSASLFEGRISALDLRAGRIVVEGDSGKTADIAFAPSRFPTSHDLKIGDAVRITAEFDGRRYIASEIVTH